MKRLGLSLAIALIIAIASRGGGKAQESEPITEPRWYNCRTLEVFTPEKQAWCDQLQKLQNATYTVPTGLEPSADYTTVTLQNGRYQRDDGQFFVELVNEQNWLAFGDINGDGNDDAAAIFGVALDPDGRQLATYLTAVLDVDGTAQALSPIRLGERILLGGPITIDTNRINLPFLTQTELIERAFVIEGMTLSEVAQQTEPDNPITLEPGPADPVFPEGTMLFSQTSRYAFRAFVQNGRPYLNLYNKMTGALQLSAVPIEVWSTPQETVYRHRGEPLIKITIASSGAQTLDINGTVMTDYAQVTGAVTYRPRIALPPDAVIEVNLVDVSRADVAAVTLASQTILVGDRQVPIPFTLVYDPEQIDPRFSYAVQARITVKDQLRFITTTRTSVITQGNPTHVEVVVDPVS